MTTASYSGTESGALPQVPLLPCCAERILRARASPSVSGMRRRGRPDGVASCDGGLAGEWADRRALTGIGAADTNHEHNHLERYKTLQADARGESVNQG